jgi:predicted membrane protein
MKDKGITPFLQLIGAVGGFLLGFILFWLFNEIVLINYEMFSILVIIDLICAIGFLVIGMYLVYKNRGFSGMVFVVAGLILLLWFFLFYVPYWVGGYWESWSYFFFWLVFLGKKNESKDWPFDKVLKNWL